MQNFTHGCLRLMGLLLAIAFFCSLSPLLAQSPANQPAGPAVNTQGPAEKQQLLDALLNQYKNKEISPGEYQRRRAEILGRAPATDPWDRASVRTSTPPAPKPNPAAPAQQGATSLAAGASAALAQATNADSLDAALVPGADLVIRIDLKAARRAPIYGVVQKLQEQRKPAAQSTPGFPGANMLQSKELFEKTLGLREEDIERIVISADIDKAKHSPAGLDSEAYKSIRGAAAIQLAKPVTTEQIKGAIEAASKQGAEEVEVTSLKLGSSDVLAVVPKSDDEPPLHFTVLGGQTVLAGLNRSSLSEALARVGKQPAPMHSVLSAGPGSSMADSQVQIGFVVPQSMRDLLKGMGEMAQAGGADAAAAAAGPGAMLGGLKDIKSVNLGFAFDKAMAIHLQADLGQGQAAAGLNMMVQMFKPQVLNSFAQLTGKTPQQLSPDLLASQVNGSKLSLSLTFDQALLEALAAQR